MGEEQARNKDVIRAHFGALSSGDADAFADTHDPGGRNDAPPRSILRVAAGGQAIRPCRSSRDPRLAGPGSPDLHAEVEDLVAEGDQVVAWIRMTGTMTGPPGPAPASGRPVNFHHRHRFRLRDGRSSSTGQSAMTSGR